MAVDIKQKLSDTITSKLPECKNRFSQTNALFILFYVLNIGLEELGRGKISSTISDIVGIVSYQSSNSAGTQQNVSVYYLAKCSCKETIHWLNTVPSDARL